MNYNFFDLLIIMVLDIHITSYALNLLELKVKNVHLVHLILFRILNYHN